MKKSMIFLVRNNPIKYLYSGIKKSPNYPKDFRDVQNGTTKNKVKDRATLDMLRTAVPGEWHKVYRDGHDSSGKKVSIHYFQHKSGKVFDVKVKDGWSNQR